MEFLSSNNSNMNESCNSFFLQQFLESQSGNFTMRNSNPTNISTAIDEHLNMLNTSNANFGCHVNTNFPIMNQSQTEYLNVQQLLSQYLSQNNTNTNSFFKGDMNYEMLNSNNFTNNYPFQLANNQIIREQLTTPQYISPRTTNQSPAIIYHSVEDCIIDENNFYGNISVLNADETKQTKIVVMPTIVYGKYLQPVLDQIKGGLFQSSVTGVQLPSDNQFSENLTETGSYLPVDYQEVSDSEEETSSQGDKSSTVGVKNSNNNYKKTNNKKGIKKKRKYIKTGLYRKDKNGNFLFSSADRSRLATLVTTPGSANQGSEVLEESTNNLFYQIASPSSNNNGSNDFNEEDRLGFELYCRETVPLHRDTSSNTLLLLMEQWKVLPQEERDRYKRSVVMGVSTQTQDLLNNELCTQLDDEISENVKDNGKYSRVKRPLNAYNIFCKIHFPEFQQQHPDLTINQISKLIGEKWKSLSNNEKQPYIEKSKNSQPVVKKPLNSYNLYCKQNFELFKKRYPDLSIHVLSRKVADSWKNLSEEEKRSYYEDALKQRQENLFQVQQSIPTFKQ